VAWGSQQVAAAFRNAIRAEGACDRIAVRMTGCHGFCERGPIVVVHPKRTFYQNVQPADAGEILTATLEGRVVDRLLHVDHLTGRRVEHQDAVAFYRRQTRRVLAGNGELDPRSIEDYIATGGYAALARATHELTPGEVIETVKRSALRGRGGAGFPTGMKWELCRSSPGEEKFVICNADEGDPGAYMDRSVLEGNPHSVIEGMLIGGYAMGANRGVIYCRAEYPLAVSNARRAIEQAREYGLVGPDILGAGLDLELVVKTGAGAFVCGEETALIASLEDLPGEPRPRPPFPAQKGLWAKPTNINNVETWANVPLIIGRGAGWYASVGTERSAGTKIFSLVGKVRNTGLVEVPMGISLRELVFDIGGGPLPGRRIKAVQTGGPSGGCIPAHLLDVPVDYESLAEAGSIMGSGGLIVMDDKTCMVDVAKYFLEFLREESCGKCVPCREGIPRMLEVLTRISEGEGRPGDVELLEQLGGVVKKASLCGLGQTAANPVLSSIRYFRDEYEAHIQRKCCPAAVCRKVISSACQHVCPLGADVPAYVTLIAKQRYVEAAQVIADTNPLPNVCARVCHHPCETACSCGEGGEAMAVKALKRFAMDRAVATGWQPGDEKPAKLRSDPVAIVGAGPAGLAAAFYLAREGYPVTIFESGARPGGALATAIPEYRLPADVLARDIERITRLGVSIKTRARVGADVSFDQLRTDFKAVFLAVGAERNMELAIPGEDVRGVIEPLAFLASAKRGDLDGSGGQLVVIGGGNVAVDAARTAVRLGWKRVFILYRRTREEMPADQTEVEAAIQEGVVIEQLVAPISIENGNGDRVYGVKCSRMCLGEMDASGRRRPVPVAGDEFFLEADTVIPAVGQRADVSFVPKEFASLVSDRGLLAADIETFATAEPGIFAGGDAVSGPATVTDAMAAGKRAAQSILQYLNGRPVVRSYEVTKPGVDVEPVELTEQELDEILEQSRPTMPVLQCATRGRGFAEIELGLDEDAAVREAKRCLRCDRATSE